MLAVQEECQKPKADDERPLQRIEHLALVLDKGSDNWCLKLAPEGAPTLRYYYYDITVSRYDMIL